MPLNTGWEQAPVPPTVRYAAGPGPTAPMPAPPGPAQPARRGCGGGLVVGLVVVALLAAVLATVALLLLVRY
jgi:hypothetical protein